ncbi:MAG: GTP-binding protein [Myxococcota bacterium]
MAKKGFNPPTTRTFAVVGHRSAGKTSLGDLLLQSSGVTRSVGRVDDGSSLLDHSVESRRKRQTLEVGHAWMEWNDHLLNLVDLPGAQDLHLDTLRALRLVDGFVLAVAANDGLGQLGQQILEEVDESKKPGIAVVHKADRPHRFSDVLDEIAAGTGRKVLALQLPFEDDEGRFAGLIDLASQRAYRYDPDGTGAYSPEPLPLRLKERAAAAWERVVEAVALADEDLLERYLEFLELPREDVLRGLAEGVRAGVFLPVLLTSTTAAVGAEPLLDALVELLPAPSRPRAFGPDDGSFVASVLSTSIDAEGRPYSLIRVWTGDADRGGTWTTGESGSQNKVRKLFAVRGPRRAVAHTTTAGAILATWDLLSAKPGETLTHGERLALPQPALPPVMVRRVLSPTRVSDPERLERALPILLAMDPALQFERDALGGEPLLGARTEGQLSRATRWLRERMGVKVQLQLPRVSYREAPLQGLTGIEGVHRRESAAGLVEEYGRCSVDLNPDADSSGIAVDLACADDDLPRRFQGAVAEGARDAGQAGPLAGYPIVGARITCTKGDYDILCSTADHVARAAKQAVLWALAESGTRLLEPWMQVTIHAPADSVGAVLQDVTGHRGRIVDVRVERQAVVVAQCPERETRTLVGRLGALTAGRAWFTSEHSHYDVLPEPLVAEAKRTSPRPPPTLVRPVPQLGEVGA